MLERALKYAKLHKESDMNVADIASKHQENPVTVYKLIRLGSAPKRVISKVKSGKLPATDAANALKSGMTKMEQLAAINELVAERAEKVEKIHGAGFDGSSMTVRRSVSIALENLKKTKLVKSDTQKAAEHALSLLFSGGKPTVSEVENIILAS